MSKWFLPIYLSAVVPVFVGFETYAICHRTTQTPDWKPGVKFNVTPFIDSTGIFPRCYKGLRSNNREGWNMITQEQSRELSRCWEES